MVLPTQEKLRRKDWKRTLTLIQGQRETILSWSSQLESDLGDLAAQLRSRMGAWDRMRQTFAALLNVLPATAAVTYVLSTGDPVGATGIKIKLTGLLGLKDLYALIAIPATAGLKKADQKQLVQLLQPVARTWLAHKITQVQTLFEQQITGELLDDARNAQTNAGTCCKKPLRRWNRPRSHRYDELSTYGLEGHGSIGIANSRAVRIKGADECCSFVATGPWPGQTGRGGL